MTPNQDGPEAQGAPAPDLTGYTREGVAAWIRADGYGMTDWTATDGPNRTLAGRQLSRPSRIFGRERFTGWKPSGTSSKTPA